VKALGVLAGALVAFLILLSPVMVSAAPSMAVSVELESYTGESPITVLGSVTPPPSGSAFATVVWTNPQGVAVATHTVPLDSLGDFQTTILAGCTPAWTPGTYTVTASAVSSGATSSASATFQYSLGVASADNVTAKVTPIVVPVAGTIAISGKVTACSGSVNYTSVIIVVKNPAGTTVFQDEVTPAGAATFGNYSDTVLTGGTPDWTPGIYVVTSQYRSSSNAAVPAFATTTFTYGQSTATSSSSLRTTLDSTQNSQSTSAASASGSTSQTSGFAAVTYAGVAIVVGAAAGALFLLRSRRKAASG
jgi:hypothetical protein